MGWTDTVNAVGSGMSGIGSMVGSIGGLIGAGASASAQQSINSSNVALAREQMAFQERMSSTAHQREVADLVKAGLNPVLSVTGGNGASSPVGSLASMVNPYANMPNQINASGQLLLQAGTALSQMKLNDKLAATEDTKQVLNVANSNVANSKNRELAQLIVEKQLDNQMHAANNAQDMDFISRMARQVGQVTGAIGNVFKGGYGGMSVASARNAARQSDFESLASTAPTN